MADACNSQLEIILNVSRLVMLLKKKLPVNFSLLEISATEGKIKKKKKYNSYKSTVEYLTQELLF